MLLRDSAVASAVRTALLNASEKVVPAQAEALEHLRLENQNLLLQSVLSDYIPEENLEEVYRILTGGNRQLFLGE